MSKDGSLFRLRATIVQCVQKVRSPNTNLEIVWQKEEEEKLPQEGEGHIKTKSLLCYRRDYEGVSNLAFFSL